MEQVKESLTVEEVKAKVGEWCAKFFTMPTEPLSKDQSIVLMKCLLIEKEGKPLPPGVLADFGFRVLDGRAKHIGLNATDWCKVMILSLCTSPGEAVMYVTALKSIGRPINVSALCTVFPDGFLTKESLETMWRAQKCACLGCDNLLDFCLQ